MSFRVRDMMAYNWEHKYRPTCANTDSALDDVHDALAEVDAQARGEFAELFVKVDALLATPGRAPEHALVPFMYDGPLRECLRCGSPFPARNKDDRYCTDVCRGEHQRFRRERKAG